MDYLINILADKQVWSIATVVLSFVGLCVSACLCAILNTNNTMSKNLKHIYIGDFLTFLITFFYGFVGILNLPEEEYQGLFIFVYDARVLVLLYLIWALWRFYNHIKIIKGY